MKASNSRYWILLSSFLFFIGTCIAQESRKVPLREVLDLLGSKFSVSFTYIDQTIDSVEINPVNENLDLSESLEYLERNTNLKFLRLDDGYISVIPKKERTRFCGYLKDEETREPIADALVYSNKQFVTTDPNGFFEFNDVGERATFLVKHIGYKEQSIKFDQYQEGCPDIYLIPDIQELEEVVIQNYLAKGIDKKEGGVTEIDVQNLDILPGLTESDVFFTLQNLPGIYSINETVSDINIRGGSNDQNLILWDGVRLYQTGHFFGLISAINPHIIGKASLTKNGTPANLGEGVSGTIEVETQKEITDPVIEVGANLVNSDVLLKIPTKKTNWMVASRQSFSGILNTPTYNQYFDRAFAASEFVNNMDVLQVVKSAERFNFYDLSLNVVHDFSKNAQLSAGFLRLDNFVEYEESVFVGSDITTRLSRLDQGSLGGYFIYDQFWSDRFKTQFSGSYMNYKQESINFDILLNQEHIQDNEVLETSLKNENTYFINDNLDLSFGLQFTETGIRNFRDINTPEYRFLSKEVMRTTSMFMQGNVYPHENTSIRFGLRGNHFSKLERFRLEPRISVLQKVNQSISIELLAENKSQTAVQTIDFQTDFLGVEARKWELANGQDIPLLTSSQLSVGANFSKSWLLLSATGFYKEVDEIISSSQGFLNQFQYIRSPGSYKATGFEVLLNPRFGNFNSWATYTYLISDYTFPAFIPPEFRSNFDISHSWSVGTSYEFRNLKISSGVNYRSGIPFTNAIGILQNENEIMYDLPNGITLKPYFRVDFSAMYTFIISEKLSSECGLSVWNVTNRENIISAFNAIQDDDIQQVNQSALGITPNISFRLIYQL